MTSESTQVKGGAWRRSSFYSAGCGSSSGTTEARSWSCSCNHGNSLPLHNNKSKATTQAVDTSCLMAVTSIPHGRTIQLGFLPSVSPLMPSLLFMFE